ncbi:GTP cyclohydrolase I FolE [Cruoricaptor ignavus]|uniref:GTP cyclohydrolase 1 n=1 Tax=Cruoricaptor ignavus TaxID=1118202 RepID=A0A7M1T6L1_9FLAO|nr:GTP cyclohydrolase I FolE [Cruoricaptor ignavus]QOR74734.1 GTP cyclohydrolase I FolE [Cruoricaptor ignavus]
MDLLDMDDDVFTGKEQTPLRKDAFRKSPAEKSQRIEELFAEIMHTLGLDMTDDSLKDSPKRVAKMYVHEIFGGLLPENKPKISTFSNKYKYRQMLVEKDISVYSFCEHHFLPIIGKAHVAYISNGEVIGLSKINRIVDYYARRPQVQERLTMQVVDAMKEALGTKDVACIIEAKHLCVNCRGIKDTASSTITAELSGIFRTNPITRQEFLHYVNIGSLI